MTPLNALPTQFDSGFSGGTDFAAGSTYHEVWEGTEEVGHTAPFPLCVGVAGGFWSELWSRGTPFSLHPVPRGNRTPQWQSWGRPTDCSCLGPFCRLMRLETILKQCR
jgi:hypothetical protein